MSNKGLDYGNGQTNIDPKTGIRYGVISQNEVLQAWADESEADYGEPTCPKCGEPATDFSESDWKEFVCASCEYAFDSDEAFGDEPVSWSYDDSTCENDPTALQAEQSGGDSDVWVIKSPYYTRAQFCSPCAPGACHLEHPMPEGEKAYCFGHEWFDGGVAPYPVYRVDDDSVVEPE